MTTRVADIITRARDTLADPKKERWSDDRLLRLLDEAQKDFARQTSLLKGYTNIPLIPFTATYSLPEDCWRITRAHYAERHLRLVSHEAMDELDQDWYTRQGSTVEALVFDQRNDSVIRCYPIPDDSSVAYNYTFEQSDTPEYAGAGRFGVVTEFGDYTFDGVFGVTTSLFDPEITTESFDSPYGVLVDAGESTGNIAIFYIRDPARIKYITDELETSSRWDIALKHYVVGHAFLDDLDTQYQQRGSTSLTLYDRELNLAQRTSRSDSTATQQYETNYNGGL